MVVEHVARWTWKAMNGTEIEVFYSLLVFLAVVLIMWWCIQCLERTRSLPPGPWGVPILGYLPFIRHDLHLQFCKLARKYGPIFSVRLGTQLVVVFSDYRIIRDTFRREEFTGRPYTEFLKILEGYGIINTEGRLWKDQRKFLHEKLRSFGMSCIGSGKKAMEFRIMHEIEIFLHEMESKRGAPTDLSPSIATSVSNVICSIIMGMRFNHDDSRFKRFTHLIKEGFMLFGSVMAVTYIPIMRFLPFVKSVMNKIEQNRAEMGNFFQESIDHHRDTYDENNTRDIVDAYLHEIKRAETEDRDGTLYYGKNHDRQMQQVLADLFSAGMETVKTTLEWAVIFMLHHPEAAKAVRDELDQVVGRSRMPTLEDLPFLPVVEATILEVLRRSSIVPLGTTHATTKDVTLNGYTIPAGSQIVPLLHAVHMNPTLWNEPESFRPSRFLTAEGKVHKPECFMPFGVGRRMCLGDVLARMELFLFFASLMHTFDMKLPEGASLPSLQANVGVTMMAEPFKVCLIQRSFDHGADEMTVNGPLRNIGSH